MDTPTNSPERASESSAGKFGVVIVLLLVLLGLGFYTMRSKDATPSSAASATPSTSAGGTVRTITIQGENFSFDPDVIRVQKGDTLRVTFRSMNGLHDWAVDEFNARTTRVGTGQTATVEFVADHTGNFEYYCSVGNHRAMGMRGALIVE